MAQEWLTEVRRVGDPSVAKNAARKAPTMKKDCHTFMEDYSKQRNKPSPILDDELVRIFRHLEHSEAEGLENYVIPLAIRLQFEFAARRSARMRLG